VKNILRGMKTLGLKELCLPMPADKHQAFRAGKSARLLGDARNISLSIGAAYLNYMW
jgi:hypothetical protein